jgi:hypothetical protein
MKRFKKITVGFVVQEYIKNQEGKFVCEEQEFVAGDDVSYEDLDGNALDVIPNDEYQGFVMVQPAPVFFDGDEVYVTELIDRIDNPDPAEKYVGQFGKVVKTGDGKSVETMINVKFENGKEDSFWPEELELIKREEE